MGRASPRHRGGRLLRAEAHQGPQALVRVGAPRPPAYIMIPPRDHAPSSVTGQAAAGAPNQIAQPEAAVPEGNSGHEPDDRPPASRASPVTVQDEQAVPNAEQGDAEQLSGRV